ncbi:MAG TPA: thioredoxin family protein [Sediminibacterium sp.]|nr:thioredoxin family protein [Sediminibacterium sp.]
MKQLFIFCIMVVSAIHVNARNIGDSAKLYTPTANAEKDIAKAVERAKKENKFVLIQAGGNWCSWCLEFNRFTTTDPKIDSAIKADFVVYHLNYSPENKNWAVFKKYGYAQRFGFPVFLILNSKGELIHIQNSAYLEKDKSYDKRKVLGFLHDWRPAAFDEKNYEYAKP